MRHGETEWSRSGRHTSRTDLPLIPEGEAKARWLGPRLHGIHFDAVFSSPMLRARQTAAIAGFSEPRITELLHEYDYGAYEGLTSPQIKADRPDWELFRDGCPGGESPARLEERTARFVELARSSGDTVIGFAHGHVLRAVATSYLGCDIGAAARLDLGTGSLSILGDGDHGTGLRLWNST